MGMVGKNLDPPGRSCDEYGAEKSKRAKCASVGSKLASGTTRKKTGIEPNTRGLAGRRTPVGLRRKVE